MNTLDGLWGIIKTNFLYSTRSCFATLFLVIGLFFFCLLLKDNYEKLNKTLSHIVVASMSIVLAVALFWKKLL